MLSRSLDQSLLLSSCVHQLEAMRQGCVSARDLLSLTCARIDDANPALNAVVAQDRARAEAVARDADDRRAAGRARPLEGLPITIKDAFEVEGFAATCGSPTLAAHRPERDATAVAHLRAAGAVILGKTNVPAWSADWQTENELFGRTRSPWDRERSPGGSSGGAVVAVATGMTSFEIGSDVAGSIRWPCHATGVFGHKPTWGAVSMSGHIPPSPWFDHQPDLVAAGPLARSAEDLALLMPLLASSPLAPAGGTPRSWRIGVVTNIPGSLTERAVVAAVEAAARALADGGALVDTLAPGQAPPLEDVWRAYLLQLCRMHHASKPSRARQQWAQRASDFAADDPSAAAWLARTAGRGDDDLRAALDARPAWWAALETTFSRYDALLMPPAPTAAQRHDDRVFEARTILVDGVARSVFDLTSWIAPATLLHLPATTAPVARTSAGLPVGVQVVGPRGADLTTIAIAGAIAAATGGFVPPPTVAGSTRLSALP